MVSVLFATLHCAYHLSLWADLRLHSQLSDIWQSNQLNPGTRHTDRIRWHIAHCQWAQSLPTVWSQLSVHLWLQTLPQWRSHGHAFCLIGLLCYGGILGLCHPLNQKEWTSYRRSRIASSHNGHPWLGNCLQFHWHQSSFRCFLDVFAMDRNCAWWRIHYIQYRPVSFGKHWSMFTHHTSYCSYRIFLQCIALRIAIEYHLRTRSCDVNWRSYRGTFQKIKMSHNCYWYY